MKIILVKAIKSKEQKRKELKITEPKRHVDTLYKIVKVRKRGRRVRKCT